MTVHLPRLISQWKYVLLEKLPGDALISGQGVAEREPYLADDLAELLRAHFQQLFDTYLYYAKVSWNFTCHSLSCLLLPTCKYLLHARVQAKAIPAHSYMHARHGFSQVEAEASTAELYRMTDSSWRMLLRDATVVGDGREQIKTMVATQARRPRACTCTCTCTCPRAHPDALESTCSAAFRVHLRTL